jgi:hypothetical protein
MPVGTYTIIGEDGEPVGTEAFRCAPGPMGWRYFSEIDTSEHGLHHEVVDIVVDADWRIVRVRIDTSEHQVLLEPSGGEHLDYLTPATNLITTKRLTGTTELDVVFIEPFTLEQSRDRQRYELHGPEVVDTPVGRFDAVRWKYTSLASGWTSDLWVADDLVVRYDRIFELIGYDPGASGPRVLVP